MASFYINSKPNCVPLISQSVYQLHSCAYDHITHVDIPTLMDRSYFFNFKSAIDNITVHNNLLLQQDSRWNFVFLLSPKTQPIYSFHLVVQISPLFQWWFQISLYYNYELYCKCWEPLILTSGMCSHIGFSQGYL